MPAQNGAVLCWICITAMLSVPANGAITATIRVVCRHCSARAQIPRLRMRGARPTSRSQRGNYEAHVTWQGQR